MSFLFNSLLTMLWNKLVLSNKVFEAANISNIVVGFATQNEILPIAFQAKCRVALCVQKRTAKDFCIITLSHRCIFSTKEKESNANLEMAPRQEMQGSFLTLYRNTSCRYRDISRWRQASIEPFCPESFKRSVVAEKLYLGTDHPYSNELARKAYLNFIKFGGSSWDQKCVSSLIRFVASITDAVDAFVLNLALNLNVDIDLDYARALDSSSLHFVKSSINYVKIIFQESIKKMNFCSPLLPQTSYFIFIFCSMKTPRYHTPIVT